MAGYIHSITPFRGQSRQAPRPGGARRGGGIPNIPAAYFAAAGVGGRIVYISPCDISAGGRASFVSERPTVVSRRATYIGRRSGVTRERRPTCAEGRISVVDFDRSSVSIGACSTCGDTDVASGVRRITSSYDPRTTSRNEGKTSDYGRTFNARGTGDSVRATGASAGRRASAEEGQWARRLDAAFVPTHCIDAWGPGDRIFVT